MHLNTQKSFPPEQLKLLEILITEITDFRVFFSVLMFLEPTIQNISSDMMSSTYMVECNPVMMTNGTAVNSNTSSLGKEASSV